MTQSTHALDTKTVLTTILALSLVLVGGLTAPLGAQEDEEQQDILEGLYVDSVDVNLVNVEVFVTDKKGNRITGLTKDDFELQVGKQEVPITNFYAVEDGKAVAGVPVAVEALPEPGLDAPPIDRPQAPPVPDDQQLHLIIYVDNFNLHPFTRNRVLSNIRLFLRSRLRPGDQVMLATYDRSLKIRHPFTKDPELIASALFEIEEVSAMAVHQDSDRRDILSQVYEVDEQYQVYGRATQYAESLYSDLNFALDALKDLVETLAGLPGRKAILHVSDGLAMRAGEDVFYAINDEFPDASSVLLDSQRYDLTRRYNALTSQANANRVTFYTMEAAGLRTYSYMDASNASPNGGARIDQIHYTNIQSSLRFMAAETGGMAMVNSNNYTPMLDRMAEDFGTYYSLGFIPSSNETGRYRDIRVRLKNPQKGIKVRHREGYRHKPVPTRMVDGTLAALHYGHQKNPMGVELEVRERERQGNGHYMVNLLVKIPIGALSFLPHSEINRGRVRLWVGAMDTEGGIAPVQDVPVPIDIPTEQFEDAQTKFYHYEMKLLMRSGRQVVAVGVRDEIGANTGFVTRSVDV